MSSGSCVRGLGLLCAAAAVVFAQSPTIGNYQLVSETRVDRTTFDYVYRATVNNPGAALNNVSATLTTFPATITALDGSLSFGAVGAGASKVSTDTFSFRYDRTLAFNISQLGWTVTGDSANRPPVANAGPDQSVPVNGSVQLNGAASSDPDGNPITYAWSFSARPAGSTATISNPALVNPTFVPDRPGQYTVQLVVTDSLGLPSLADQMVVTTSNSPPTANAGPDQTVTTGAVVQLNGSGSSDVDGNSLTFTWLILTRPPGSAAALSNPAIVNPTFVADKFGSYTIQLIVNDGTANSVADQVVVSTQNSPPVANAGPDQTVLTGANVQLNGSGSTDVDGQALTYAWTFVSRPAGSAAALVNPSAVNPTFVADKFGSYTVQLIVNDGTANSVADQVVISTQNSPPVANAGPDQTVAVSQLATLNGSGSSDVDGQALTYSWSFVSRPAGSGATLSNPSAVMPTFTVDVSGTYVIQLIVNDGIVASVPDQVVVTTSNTPPVANAGPDQTALVNGLVTLNGSASSDVDGNSLTFVWSFASRPAGSTATLSNPAAVMPTFTVDKPGTYVVQLIVSDGFVNSPPDTVSITTLNSPPTANAGADKTALVGETVQLSGAGSTDVDGNPLTYSWSLSQKPAGSAAVLSNAAVVNPSFVADKAGTYVAQLIVNDGTVNSAPDTVTITTSNSPPTAAAGPDQTVTAGATVNLNGSGSSDPDADPLTYAWSMVSRPAGSTAVLANATAVAPSFVADKVGNYVIQLIVNDGSVNSAPDQVVITTQNSAPTANAGPDQTVPLSSVVQLNGAASSDPDNQPLTYSWSILSRPATSAAVLSNSTTVSPTFTADKPGIYVVQLIVNDGIVDSAPDTVRIDTLNTKPTANAGANQAVATGATVQLDGSGSTDPEANALTYQWLFLSRPGGSAAALSNSTIVNPTFIADVAGVYVVQLIVNDGALDSNPASVTINASLGTVGLTISPSPIGLGRTSFVTVLLTTPAPAGGRTVTVTSDNPAIAAIQAPGTTFIAAGQTTGQVIVSGAAAGNTLLRANTAGYTEGSVAATVTPNLLNLPPSVTVGLGLSTQVPVTISPNPAPAGGLEVSVTSSNPAIIEVLTPVLSIPAGQTAVNVTVRGANNGQATITVTAPGYSPATTVVTASAEFDITETTVTIRDGFPDTFTTVLKSAGSAIAAPTAPGVTVNLVASNPQCVSVPATSLIPAGLASVQSTVSYGGTAVLPCTTTVTASAPGIASDSVSITVNTKPILSTGADFKVGSGLQEARGVSLGFAGHGGVTVRVESSDPTKVLISKDPVAAGAAAVDFVVPNGNTNFTYYAQGLESTTGTATVTVSHPSFVTDSLVVTVVQPGVEVHGLSATYNVLDADGTNVYVQTGLPNAANTSLASVQNVRGGSPGFLVTLTNGTASVAQIKTASTPAGGQTVTVPIPPNTYYSQGSPGSYGILFDPLGVGTTTVTASKSDGVTMTTSGIRNVQVIASAITAPAAQTIGHGLQVCTNATLGGGSHGGVTVTITSGNATLALVSLNGTTAGTPTISLPLPNGTTNVPFCVQGMENQTGSTTINITAPGFSDASFQATMVNPGVELHGLGATYSTLDADVTGLYVQTGLPNAGNTALSNVQNVRAGSPGFLVTLTNSNATAARIKTASTPAGGQTVTVPIPSNTYYSQGPPGSYGILFDLLGAGTTTVTASGTNMVTMTTSGVRSTTVTGASINVPANQTVGAGLQVCPNATLDGTAHGGVTVRVESSDPTKVLIAPNGTTPGTSFVDVVVANGQSNVPYCIQGVENQTGPVTVSLTTPTFNPNSYQATVAVPAVEIIGLSATYTSLAADDTSVYVQVGLPNGAGTAVSNVQNVRAGSPGFVVTLSNSNASAAQLKTASTPGGGQSVTVPIPSNTYYSQGPPGSYGILFDPIGPGTTTITASRSGVLTATTSGVRNVTVTGASITVPASTVGAGLQDSRNATLGGASHGGVNVTIESSNPSVAVVSPNATTPGSASITIPIANGTTNVPFYVQGVEGAAGTVTLIVSATGFTNGTNTVTVVQPAIDIQSLSASTTTLGPDESFYVGVGYANANGTAIAGYQHVRAGSSVVATVTNSNASAGSLKAAALNAQSVPVTIPAGSYYSQGVPAPYGIVFDPAPPGGSTTIQVSAAGYIAVNTASRTVTVNPSSITLTAGTIGTSLQELVNCSLAGSNHGGVTVTYTSSDPTRVLLAPNSTTVGAASITRVIANGQTSCSYYLVGVDGATPGPSTISVSAPGFTSNTVNVNAVTPTVDIQGLPATIAAAAGNNSFYVQVGIPNAGNTAIGNAQSVRFGHPGLAVTVNNSNAVAGQLVSSLGSAQSATATIPAGNYYTLGNSPSPYGLAFDPLAPGTTLVSATVPGFVPVNTGTRSIAVQ